MGLFDFFKKDSKNNLHLLYLIFGNIVAQQDGHFSKKETEFCFSFLADDGLNGDEITKVYNKIPKTDHKDALSMAIALEEKDKIKLCDFLIGLALSDGEFDAREAMSIATIGNQIGLDGTKVMEVIVQNSDLTYDDIHQVINKGPIGEKDTKQSLGDNYEPLKEVMNKFEKNIEDIKEWYEIIKSRGQFEELYASKNDVEQHDFYFFGEGHAIEYIKKYENNKQLGIDDMNDRIEIFTRLILELQKIIDKCKELNIRLSQPFLNDYYASQSSLEGAKIGYIIMAARGERHNIVKLREFINGPDKSEEDVSNSDVLLQAGEIDKKVTKNNNSVLDLLS